MIKNRSYFQAYVAGESRTGLFCCNGNRTTWLGTTAGLVAREIASYREMNLPPFLYSGSSGPLFTSSPEQAAWWQIGDSIAKAFRLRGVFGVDAIQSASGEIVPIEVNPRYTASMELLDLAYDESIAGRHVAACLDLEFPSEMQIQPGQQRDSLSKLILYALDDFPITRAVSRRMLGGELACELQAITRLSIRIADIPAGNSLIRRGHPLCTLLIRQPTSWPMSVLNGEVADTIVRQSWECISQS
jgi:predicted ATP-grasp superfamily ATP-dependent carboligase